MPYLDSNQDVRKNELFNKVLLGSAVLVGAAALGQSMGKNMGSLFKNWGKSSGSKVAKGLYGDAAEGFSDAMVDGITTAGRNVDGPQYKVKNKLFGGQKVKRTDGSWMDRMRSNRSDDVKGFNTQLKDLHDGRRFSDSKLSMYEDVMEGSSSRNINLDTKQGMNVTENAYNSKASSKARKELGINNLADDAELTNSIWDTPENELKFSKDNVEDQSRIKYAKDRAEMDRRDLVEQLQYQGKKERGELDPHKKFNKVMKDLNGTDEIPSQPAPRKNAGSNDAHEKFNRIIRGEQPQQKPNQAYTDSVKQREKDMANRKDIKYQSGKESTVAPNDGEAFGMNLDELRSQYNQPKGKPKNNRNTKKNRNRNRNK